ncbi:MAG: BatA domain-containing protein [Candidatus Hydrogenedentes bacterium]|nr:BatA domain-containing protein [Candidatus Hydrogenedentota bacterium]
MGFTLLSPLLLAAIGLAAVPWILHRMQRPERKPVAFSSLMFVPPPNREIVRRKQIQHWILLLMRIAALILLALAFAQPAWRTVKAQTIQDQGGARHVFAIDTSASMQVLDHFDQARRELTAALDALGGEEDFALLAFDETAETLLPFRAAEETLSSRVALAKERLAALVPGWRATHHVPMMQLAERLLLDTQTDRAMHVHVYSDLQRTGLAEALEWRAPVAIQVHAHRVGAAVDNGRVEAVAIDGGAPEATLRARVRHLGAEKIERTVQLQLDGQPMQEKSVQLEPGTARTVVFTIPLPESAPARGYLRITPDAMSADDTFYFAYNPQPATRVLLRTGTGAAVVLGKIVELALMNSGPLRWDLTAGPEDYDVALIVGSEGLEASLLAQVEAGVRAGKAAMLIPGSARLQPELAALLASGRARVAPGAESQGAFALHWLNFQHPVLRPFRSAEHNDFSALRFTRVHPIEPGLAQEQIIFTFEESGNDAGIPGAVDIPLDAGRMLFWAFSPELDASNLTKSTRFVPLVQECMAYLHVPVRAVAEQTIGATSRFPATDDAWRIVHADAAKEEAPHGGVEFTATTPGWTAWHEGDSAAPRWIQAANLAVEESNLEQVSEAEYVLRLSSQNMVAAADGVPGTAKDEEETETWPLGPYALMGFACMLVMENSYAARTR